jgi:hypothetical protein
MCFDRQPLTMEPKHGVHKLYMQTRTHQDLGYQSESIVDESQKRQCRVSGGGGQLPAQQLGVHHQHHHPHLQTSTHGGKIRKGIRY